MGKVKAAKIEAGADASEADEVALVVFGRDEGGRAHASRFSAADAQLAERAAGIMGMWVLRLIADEHRKVASELPAGRVFASGKGFVPFCADGTYKRLEAFDGAFQPEPPTDAAPVVHCSIPDGWAAIDVGALVLACEAPGSGFFECLVGAAPGDGLFELRWLNWPDLPPFVRRREHLALLTTELASLADQLDELPPEAAGAPPSETDQEASA